MDDACSHRFGPNALAKVATAARANVAAALLACCAFACAGDRATAGPRPPSLRDAADARSCEDARHDASARAGCDADAAVDASASGDGSMPTPAERPECSAQSAGITLASLVSEMIDLTRLARVPEVAYTSHLASSHDPRSDAAQPGDAGWFANHDYVALQPDAPVTLFDVDGPGVITRIWSASPAGVLRVYVDGSDRPVIEAELAALLRGDVAPFTPPFGFVAAFGHNLYFPIPFARAARVTLTGEADRVYYQLAYRRYPEGTSVESFGEAALAASECERTRVAERLDALEPDSDAVDFGTTQHFELGTREPARRSVSIGAGPDGGMLWQLRVRASERDEARLRSTLLRIAFDGIETVRAPLGDFFATAIDATEINSLPIGVTLGGTMTARWPMPFRTEARISIEATDAADLDLELEVVHGEATFSERSLYFHAQWRAPETFASEPRRDWRLAEITGRGMYAGNLLNVVNRAPGWWGEGDEKIYVDGAARAAHFGTGTEDYYGYAWCSNQRFTTAYVGQPVATKQHSFGYVSLYRFHVFDAIPFQTGLRFDLEVSHWGDPVDVTYDALSFWYAQPGARAAGTAEDPAAFRIPALGTEPPAGTPEGAYRCGG